MMVRMAVAASLLSLSACMSTSGSGADTGAGAGNGTPIHNETPGGRCDAASTQVHIGSRADQAIGAQILSQSGARRLRWGAPDSAWTMDYREDRVNVRYDREMIITSITCG